jgi:hypothetical protein
MFEETQKQDTGCLKLPKGKVPTDQEIDAAITKLSFFEKIRARTAWTGAKSLEEREPQQAAGKLVNFLSKKPCTPEEIGLDQAKQLFRQELELNVPSSTNGRASRAREQLKRTIQEIRTKQNND